MPSAIIARLMALLLLAWAAGVSATAPASESLAGNAWTMAWSAAGADVPHAAAPHQPQDGSTQETLGHRVLKSRRRHDIDTSSSDNLKLVVAYGAVCSVLPIHDQPVRGWSVSLQVGHTTCCLARRSGASRAPPASV